MTAASAMIVEKLTFGLVSAENLVNLGKWVVKDRKAEADAKRAEEQRKLLAEQYAKSLRKGKETINESNYQLYELMHSDKADDTIRSVFTALEKSGELSKNEKYKIAVQHVDISRRIVHGNATGADLTSYRNSLDILRQKLSKNPEKYTTEIAKLNDLIANVDALDTNRTAVLNNDNVYIDHRGNLKSSVVVDSSNVAKQKEKWKSRQSRRAICNVDE